VIKALTCTFGVELRGLEPLTPTLPVRLGGGRERAATSRPVRPKREAHGVNKHGCTRSMASCAQRCAQMAPRPWPSGRGRGALASLRICAPTTGTVLRPELQQWQELAWAASTAPDLLDLATPDIAERWTALPLARQRAVIDLLLDIAVLPATRAGGHGGFDPNSIRITWKPTT